jgi:hypothetical protein
MSDFRMKINMLNCMPYLPSLSGYPSYDSFFEVEYYFGGMGNMIRVQPVLISNTVVFLVHFAGGEEPSAALMYNKKNEWSDIEKESTGLTEAIGNAIENYYSTRQLPWSENPGDYQLN